MQTGRKSLERHPTGLFRCDLSGTSTLYTLVRSCDIDGRVIARALRFGDCEVELKLVYEKQEYNHRRYMENNYEDYDVHYDPYLLESTTKNEVLLIYQMKEGIVGKKTMTTDFRVYKIDPENGSFLRVESLGNQILFLVEKSEEIPRCSLSIPAGDFKGLKGNCIYAVISGTFKFASSRPTITPNESGLFYLDGGRFEISTLPGVNISTECGLSWFSPSL